MRITDAARGRWCEILPQFGYNPPSNPRLHGPCPLCGGKDRFRFDDLNGSGTWFCNQCGHGDGMDLVTRMTGKPFADARLEVFQMLGIAPSPSPEQSNGPQADFKTQLERVWSGATFVERDCPVGRYLRRRTGISDPSKSIRHHPALWNPTVKSKLHAMVAKVASFEGRVINLHCTFLTVDGKKADVSPAKRVMRGPMPDGCAIRIGQAAPIMGIAEGIETAISASVLHGIPVWAAINGSLLAKWIPPDIAEEVVIFADNDANFTGQSKAYALANRISVQYQRKVMVLLPPEIGQDWNDHHRIIIDRN